MPEQVDVAEQRLDLVFKVNTFEGRGMVTDEGFVVCKGSILARTYSDSAALRVAKLRDQLIADGRATVVGDRLVLNEDVLLSSASYAAVLVAGTSRNGLQSWLAPDGRTLKALEEAQMREFESAVMVSLVRVIRFSTF